MPAYTIVTIIPSMVESNGHATPPEASYIMSTYWAETCYLATGRSLQVKLSAVYGSASVTVRFWPDNRSFYLAADVTTRHCLWHHVMLTTFVSDFRLFPECFGQRDHVLFLAAHWRGGSAACVAALRMFQRADAVRQLLWGCNVGGLDAA